MKKELQDLAWSVLPKEFKDKVKELYREFASTREGYYKELFGRRNLTSDAEGEEMLYCDKSVVQSMAKSAIHSIQIHDYKGNTIASQNMATFNRGIKYTLESLFGSKCLPDETASESKPFKYSVGQKVILHFYGGEVSTITEAFNDGGVWNKYKVKMLPTRVWNENELDPYEEPKPAEPKFKVGDKVKDISTPHDDNIYKVDDIKKSSDGFIYHIQGLIGISNVKESALEPYVEPTEEDSANAQPKSVGSFHIADEETHLRNYSRDMANCDKSDNNRLQIAAMAMQGMLGNAEITSFENLQDAIHREYIVEYALHYADALIAKSGKGGLQ